MNQLAKYPTNQLDLCHSRSPRTSFIEPVFHHYDVTDLDTLKATVDKIEQAHGVIHILINNAAAAGSKAGLDTENVTAEE